MSNSPEFEQIPEPTHNYDVGVLRVPEVEVLYDSVTAAFADDSEQGDTAHLVNLEGDHIEVTRLLKPEQFVVDEGQTSIGGLFKRLTSRFRKVDAPAKGVGDPYTYTVSTTSSGSNEKITLALAAYSKHNSLFSMGEREIELPEGGTAITFLGEREIAGYMADIQGKMATAERFSVNTMLEAKQLGPCSRIEGVEAAKMYSLVMPTVNALLNRTEGYSEHSPTALISGRLAILDTIDGLPISNIGVVRSQFGGDTTSISVTFGENPFVTENLYAREGDPFVVDISRTTISGKSVLSVKYRLIRTDPFTPGRTMDEFIALDPRTRARVQSAITQQVRPDNLRDLK